jgi:hypothetical protein
MIDGRFMTSKFILYTLFSTFSIYKKERLPPATRTRHRTQHLFSLLSCSTASPFRSCARTTDWKSRPPEPRLRLCQLLGCPGRLGFQGTSNAIAHCWSDQRLRLLPSGHSRHCTANIILHQLWSVTSSKTLCRVVRMEPPVPWAWVSPLALLMGRVETGFMGWVLAWGLLGWVRTGCII